MQNVFPVCSPESAVWHNLSPDAPDIVEKLAAQPFLECVSVGASDIEWDDWFEMQNVPYRGTRSDYVFDNVQYMIQAVLDGEGVALGLYHLIENNLKSGDIVQIGPTVDGAEDMSWIEFNTDRISETDRDRQRQIIPLVQKNQSEN